MELETWVGLLPHLSISGPNRLQEFFYRVFFSLPYPWYNFSHVRLFLYIFRSSPSSAQFTTPSGLYDILPSFLFYIIINRKIIGPAHHQWNQVPLRLHVLLSPCPGLLSYRAIHVPESLELDGQRKPKLLLYLILKKSKIFPQPKTLSFFRWYGGQWEWWCLIVGNFRKS